MFRKSFVLLFLIICISLSLFTSCKNKERINISSEVNALPYLTYSIQIPDYTEYPEFSKTIRESLEKDFDKYKSFAKAEWEYDDSDIFTYRTIFEDYSNKDYLNVFIRKYIFCGPSMEDEFYITFCWDKKQKKIVSIEEVTGLTSTKLMDYCRQYVRTHLKDVEPRARDFVDSCVDQALNEDIKKYSNFVAKKKSVTIHFAPDGSAPKGYGPQTVEIKLK